jgi:hypothetical protein
MTIFLNGQLIQAQSPDPVLFPGDSATLTFNGPITAGDAAAIILQTSLLNQGAVVPSALVTDTPVTMAAKAAAMIAVDPTLSTWVTASVSDTTLTLTNITAGQLSLTVNIGNGGTETIEIGRRSRHLQIVVWARTPDDRDTVSDPIEQLVATLEYNFGVELNDGTLGRLTFYGDIQRDDATLSDTLRRDFMVCVEYSITTTDQAYAVLVGNVDVMNVEQISAGPFILDDQGTGELGDAFLS